MQSTGQTSTHASQPVQLSARTTANALGTFFRALPAPFAMVSPLSRDDKGILADQGTRGQGDTPCLLFRAGRFAPGAKQQAVSLSLLGRPAASRSRRTQAVPRRRTPPPK